jgi:DNA-binding NarL/FixJ family response regulator
MSEAEAAIPILALVRDLMFSSQIMAEARAAGATMKMIRDPAEVEKFAQSPAQLMITDLNLPGATAAAAAWRKVPGRTVVGFVSHVDAEAISQAREAGIDQVIARSRFVQILPNLVRGKIA